jgi:hypothetical protein
MSVGNPEKPGGTLRADDIAVRQISDAMPVLACPLTAQFEVELATQALLDYFGVTLDELKTIPVNRRLRIGAPFAGPATNTGRSNLCEITQPAPSFVTPNFFGPHCSLLLNRTTTPTWLCEGKPGYSGHWKSFLLRT